MTFKHYLEEEDDKPYFTTNSLGYYYDKMEGFAALVENAAKTLNMTKEEMEKQIALRLAEWDVNISDFPESVTTLLTEWVDNGTLNHIIDTTLIDEKIAPVTEQLDKQIKNIVPSYNRAIAQYYASYAIQLRGLQHLTMGGFRFMGQYYKQSVKTASLPEPMPATLDLRASRGQLGCQTGRTFSTWYAAFGVMNEGDAIGQIKAMPFFRVASIEGNVITLGLSGENENPTIVKDYLMLNDVLAGSDLLVISEFVGTREQSLSGRVTKVLSNTTSSLTVENIGGIGIGDTILAAPPNFDHYGYLCTFYHDTAEVRNISDTGSLVKSRGVRHNIGVSFDGTLPVEGVYAPMQGFISPLATGAIIGVKIISSGTVTGSVGATVGMDHIHDYHIVYNLKTVSGTYNHWDSSITCPFLFRPWVNVRSGGQVPDQLREVHVRGWIET